MYKTYTASNKIDTKKRREKKQTNKEWNSSSIHTFTYITQCCVYEIYTVGIAVY